MEQGSERTEAPAASPESKVSRWLQEVPVELAQEYKEMQEMLPGYFKLAGEKLRAMERAGIPDRGAYDKLRHDMDEVYERFKTVHREVVQRAENVQDAFVAAMKPRRATDFSFERRKEPLEFYDGRMEELMAKAIDLEEVVEKSDPNDARTRDKLRLKLAEIFADMEDAGNAVGKEIVDQSREHASLRGLIEKLKERLRRPEELPELELVEPEEEKDEFFISERQPHEALTAASVSELRGMHKRVRASYASIQHTLTEDQRQGMRRRIAQLSELVRRAEDDAWTAVFMPKATVPEPPSGPPPPPEPPPVTNGPEPVAEQTEPDPLSEAIQLAVAHASRQAPEIAKAVLASSVKPPSSGVFRALGNAFKLK